MNRGIARFLGLGLVAVALGVAGCSKGKKAESASAVDPQALAAAQKLPEGTNVLAALEQKDYDATVTALAKVQQEASGGDYAGELAVLRRYVREKLSEASATDPKAAEALSAIRMITQGR